MPKFTEEDQQRLWESGHDIAALRQAERLTSDPDFQRIAVKTRDELAHRREQLYQAALLNFQELKETRVESSRLDSARLRSIRLYGFVWDKLRGEWMASDPDHAADAAKLSQKRETLDRIFNTSIPALHKQSARQLATTLEALVEALAAHDELRRFGWHDRLALSVAGLLEALDAWQREVGENRVASHALRAARDNVERASQVHAAIVRAILLREDRLAELGAFLQAEDPSYRARRQSSRPISEEQGPSYLAPNASLP
jgi:hypothetical protein